MEIAQPALESDNSYIVYTNDVSKLLMLSKNSSNPVMQELNQKLNHMLDETKQPITEHMHTYINLSSYERQTILQHINQSRITLSPKLMSHLKSPIRNRIWNVFNIMSAFNATLLITILASIIILLLP